MTTAFTILFDYPYMATAVGILLLVLIVAVVLRILRDRGPQFPTAYTLLRSSPLIERRERRAVAFCVVMMVLFLLLLLTAVI